MADRKKPHATSRTKPCPDPLKGSRCPLCGGAYVCLQSWRKKARPPAVAVGGANG